MKTDFGEVEEKVEHSITKECEKFIKAVVPEKASDNQRRDMKHSFMSGAYTLLTMFMRKDFVDDEDNINKIAKEMHGYFEPMRREYIEKIEKDLG